MIILASRYLRFIYTVCEDRYRRFFKMMIPSANLTPRNADASNSGGGDMSGLATLAVGNGLHFSVVHARIPGLIQTINILSCINIPLCAIIIAVVLVHTRKHNMRDRVSFRLSASIALADMLYAIIQLIFNDEKLTDSFSSLQIRTIGFFHLLGFNALIFTTTCIAFHLHLTALLSKQKLAHKFSPWYELVSWVVAALVAHPTFYAFDRWTKIKAINIIVLGNYSESRYHMVVWLMYGWCAAALVYCLLVCILVIIRMLPLWKKAKNNRFTQPEGGGGGGGENSSGGFGDSRSGGTFDLTYAECSPQYISYNSGNESSGGMANSTGSQPYGYMPREQAMKEKRKSRRVIRRRKREVTFAVTRIALYSLIPLICTPILPVYLTMEHPSVVMVNVTVVLPSLCGILNFVVFMANPMLDPTWKKMFRWAKKRYIALTKGCVSQGQDQGQQPNGHDNSGGGDSKRWTTASTATGIDAANGAKTFAAETSGTASTAVTAPISQLPKLQPLETERSGSSNGMSDEKQGVEELMDYSTTKTSGSTNPSQNYTDEDVGDKMGVYETSSVTSSTAPIRNSIQARTVKFASPKHTNDSSVFISHNDNGQSDERKHYS
ncbi:hypothetical protein H4219_003654 [Mycoemilia scoparia]|uniref:Uncharacterized protein n=1 Tax=Mycoemilia scoparia TaxID=417184 RepID=A0A9W8DMI7_9FUNG|nr:hypothetical protein H4219_003654 [Mycoemilia scoparia]